MKLKNNLKTRLGDESLNEKDSAKMDLAGVEDKGIELIKMVDLICGLVEFTVINLKIYKLKYIFTLHLFS